MSHFGKRGMIASVILGITAAIVALGKVLGLWTVSSTVPMMFAIAGVLGTIALVNLRHRAGQAFPCKGPVGA